MFPRKRSKTDGRASRPAVKAGVVGTVVAATLTGGLVLAPQATAADTPTPAATGSMPGVGSILSGGSAVYSMIARCMHNQDNNIDCMQSSDQTLAEVHSQVKEIHRVLVAFTLKYEEDQKRTSAALDTIIQNQADAYVRDQWKGVRSDLETSHISLKLYNGLTTCATAATSPEALAHIANPAEPMPTCNKVNQFGSVTGTQPADLNSILTLGKEFQDNQTRNASGVGGFNLSPSDFAQRVGGTTVNPYASSSLLNAVLQREQVDERIRQGLPANAKITFFPASYVNKLGVAESSMVALEENYFTTRIIASKFAGDTTLANDLEDLATNGRPDNSPILSVLQQYKSFTFPGWSPDKPMPATDAFIAGPKSGVIRISNRGTTADSVTTADTPTPDQVQSLASDLATSGTTYSKLSEVYPDALPAAQGQQGQGNPDQVGRIWTKPQEIDGVTLNMRQDSDPSNGQEHFVRRADIGDWSHSFVVWSLRAPGAQLPTVHVTKTASVPYLVYNNLQSYGGGSMATKEGTWSYPGIGSAYAIPATQHWYTRVRTCRVVPKGKYEAYECNFDNGGPHGPGSSILFAENGALPSANLGVDQAAAEGLLQLAADQA